MSLQSGFDLDKTYFDSKYGVDVIVRFINGSIVVLTEEDTGKNRLCKREDFDNNRFQSK